MDVLVQTLLVILFLVLPYLSSTVFSKNYSFIKGYFLGQYMIWSFYAGIALILNVFKLKIGYQYYPLLALIPLFPILFKNRQNLFKFKLFSVEDIGPLAISGLIIIMFCFSVVNYSHGTVLPIFSRGWDAAVHFLFTDYTYKQNSLFLVTFYPFNFHINMAVTYASLIPSLGDANDISLRISIFSLMTVYIYITILVGVYYALINLKVSQTVKHIGWERGLFLSMAVVFLTGDIMLSIFRHGFFSYLMALGFLIFLVYFIVSRNNSYGALWWGIWGFVSAYYYLAPLLLPILIRGFRNPKYNRLQKLGLLLSLSLPIAPRLYTLLTKISETTNYYLTNPGGYQIWSTDYILVIILALAVSLWAVNRYERKFMDRISLIMELNLMSILILGGLYVVQMGKIGRVDYTFNKPLIFSLFLMVIIIIAAFDKLYFDLVYRKMSTRLSRIYLTGLAIILMMLVSFNYNLGNMGRLVADVDHDFSFLQPDIYNQALNFRKTIKVDDRPVITLLAGSDNFWSLIMIGDINRIMANNPLMVDQTMSLDQIDKEVTGDRNQSYLIFDPLRKAMSECDRQMVTLVQSYNVTFFPLIDKQEFLKFCKLKTS